MLRPIVALRGSKDDETLLVQSGKPVGVFQTHADAPRVLIANSNLVPHWATWEHFNELDRKGLMMYGQMTAGSWIYIGSAGHRAGHLRDLRRGRARKHFGGDARGQWILTRGLGGMGGAQPLAATMAGVSMLAVECDESRIEMRLRTGYLDRNGDDARRGARHASRARRAKRPVSVGLLGNAAEIFPELVRRGITPDLVTDQTSAHDPLNGYLPRGWSLAKAAKRRRRTRKRSSAAPRVDAKSTCGRCSTSRRWARSLDYGNNIRQVAKDEGVTNAFDFPGFVPAYIRPLFCDGIGPFRWVALSGDPEDIDRTDAKVKELFPDDAHLHHWLDMARERIKFQGLPARICWLGLGTARGSASRSTTWWRRASSRRRSSSAATTSTPARSRARTARPRRCATAPTPCPTGRS